MSRLGFTMPELVIGIFLIGVVSLVLGRMMRSFVMLTNYTLKQTSAIASVRRGLINSVKGKDNNMGLVWAAQEAKYVRSLSATTLQLTSSDTINGGDPVITAVDYYVTTFVSTSFLVQDQAGLVTRQAPDITSLHVDYFEIGSDGHIFESTVAAQASMAAFTLGVAGKGKTKSYTVYSAAQLRNYQDPRQ